MLSKEEIEYIQIVENVLENKENFYWQEDMYELMEIIKRQQTREQKLIEKLEKDIANDYQIKKLYGDKYCTYGVKSISTKEYAQEILSILKGENYE